MSSTVEKSVEVAVPIRVAYNQWTQFEDFPKFMKWVKEVRQIDPKKTHWTAEIGFKMMEWDADTIEQVPDTQISWRHTSGAPNEGSVHFTPLGADRTRVTARITYQAESILQHVADSLGLMSSHIQGDLDCFKTFIEGRGSETGGWRGEIHSGEVQANKTS